MTEDFDVRREKIRKYLFSIQAPVADMIYIFKLIDELHDEAEMLKDKLLFMNEKLDALQGKSESDEQENAYAGD